MIRSLISQRLTKWESVIVEAVKGGASRGVIGQLIRERNRWRCRNDLFYLCKVCGFDKIVEIPRIYEPFCDEVSLMNWGIVGRGIQPASEGMIGVEEVKGAVGEISLERLYLCFRAFYKSTIISKAHTLQLLLNFPNIHIVIVHNKQDNASSILMSLKEMFLTTELRYWFSECLPKGKEWGNSRGFSLGNRTDLTRDEDNVEAVGVGTEITGRHWQVAKKNDLVTEDSVNSKHLREEAERWDDMFNIGHFDDPTLPVQDYEGTRYHFSDIYSRLLGNKRLKAVIIPIMKDFDDEKSITIPERFTVEGIRSLKAKEGVFWCQHMLEPKDPQKMGFRRENIYYWREIPAGLNYYLLIDPASARKKKSDYTVMIVVGIGGDGRRYIVDGIRDKLDPARRISEALKLCIRWNVRVIGWEAIGFQSTDCYYFEERRRLEGISVILEEINSQTVSKEDRIRGLMPEYGNGKWLWPEKNKVTRNLVFNGELYDLTVELETELLEFPQSEHDDLLDVQTFLNVMKNVIMPCCEDKPVEEPKMTMGEYSRLKGNRLREETRNPFSRLYVRN